MTLQAVSDAEAWGNVHLRFVTVQLVGSFLAESDLRRFFYECRPRAGEGLSVFQDAKFGLVATLRAPGVKIEDIDEVCPIHQGRRFLPENAAMALRAAMDLAMARSA